jgi:hypothetical protein
MSKPRASIFDTADDLDLGGFAPKSSVDTKGPPAEAVRAVAEAAQFRSREASPSKPPKPSKRKARVYRTGRNVQFAVKATKEIVDTFYAITEAQNWVMGETLERAIGALQRELSAKP